MRKIFYTIVLLSLIIASCSKEPKITGSDGGGTDNPTGPSIDGTTLDLIKDSVFLYAKETYYWNKDLPDYATFKPRSFTGTNDIDALANEVDGLSQYAIDSETGRPYEYYSPAPGYAKYSFIDDGSVSEELNGINGDFGFAPIWIKTDDLRIKYVYPGSPADLKGVKRGYKIVAMNNRTDLDYTNDNVQFVIDAYSASENITMKLQKPDGSTIDVSISTTSYTVNPVLASKVIDAGGGKKVGYIAFNTFTSPDNAKPKLDAAFTTFAAQGVTDLVVDLRYNGGGYVATAEYLSDLIVPSSATGSLMYTTFYNEDLQKDNHPLLSKIYDIEPGEFLPTNPLNFTNFSKAGTLNINRVFFIVTGSTASASELTINNLIPKMNVQLIGSTTYGKPVGFFAIDINKYQLYVPQFETKNAAGNGDYYAGMEPGSSKYMGAVREDDVTKEFGDPTEGLLLNALNYIKTGTYAVKDSQQLQSLERTKTFSIAQANQVSNQMDARKFKGMISDHIKPKKKSK